MSDGMKITNNGRNLLAKGLTGKTITFTRVIVGDGVITNQNILTLNSLINQKKILPIVQLNKTENIGTAEVICEMNNSDLTNGFWVREFGLFARDPDTNQEILYSYRNVGNEASYLPGSGGPDVVNYTLSLVTVIDQAQNVTAIMTTNNNYVTSTNLTMRLNALFGAYRNISGFWTYSETGEKIFRPATLQQVKDALIGDYDINSLAARIRVLEDALSQVLMSIELENLYPDYTHFICEDFLNTNELDLYSCKVTSIVAGDDSIDCEPLDGILPGSFYMLSDGISQELAQVDSVSIENNIQRVILCAPVENTYILNSCMLYRTSANILSGMATGANSRKTQTWPAALTWRGTSANAEITINLDTSTNNSNAFEIDGAGVFNSSGQVTLEI